MGVQPVAEVVKTFGESRDRTKLLTSSATQRLRVGVQPVAEVVKTFGEFPGQNKTLDKFRYPKTKSGGFSP